MKRNTIVGIVFIFLIACNTPSEKIIIESKVDNLLVRFNQLHSEKNTQFYLKKSVYNGDANFEIQLYAEPESLTDPQQILVFVNRNSNKVSAIPFFSNSYRDYYEFQFDSKPLDEIGAVKTKFAKEFNKALFDTGLNKDSDISEMVLIELMSSLLNAKLIYPEDTADLKITFWNYNDRIVEDNYHSAEERIQKNYEELKTNIDNDNPAILDSRNYRIYQINNIEENRKDATIFSIKTYRQDEVMRRLNM